MQLILRLQQVSIKLRLRFGSSAAYAAQKALCFCVVLRGSVRPVFRPVTNIIFLCFDEIRGM